MPRRGSLASHLSTSARQFEKRQLAHFKKAFEGPASDDIVRAILGMTRALFDSGSGMVKPRASGLPSSLAATFLENPGKPGRLHAQIELEIARSLALSTDEMAQRCLELARLALTHPPADAVSRYLQRLGRCYIAGFFPETVIICRAILENAVLDKFEREGKPLPIPPSGRSDMRARLSRAEDHQWITRKQSNDAWSIWERGSKAAHRDPNLTTAVLETVETTMDLVGVLYA